jgi:hypothetical protein
LIRKLFAAGAVLAVAVIAVMLMTVGGGTKSAEAHVQSISGPGFISPTGIGLAEIHIVAQDHNLPFNGSDIRVTASAGGFVSCEYQDTSPCETYAEVTGLPFPILWSAATICDDSGFPCTGGGDVDFITLEWAMAEGFPGGSVLFTACQFDQNCPDQAKTFVMQVGGAPATVTIKAQRDYTNEDTSCQGTPVYVIAAVEYTFNNPTTFDNNRAIICADVRDSAGHALGNEQVVFSTTDGCFSGTGTTTEVENTGSNSLAHVRLESCSTGHSGDVATVTAQAGGVYSNAVEVQFGGDPASCSMPDITSLDIGDTAHVVATFLDAKGNWVPDGIVGHLEEVDSGDGADNVQFVSVNEDTVKGVIEGDVIGAISGLTTVAASVEQIAGADVVCSDEIELTGDVHVTPVVCDDPDMILAGFPPPAGGGFGTFEFCGGTYEQLFDASNCPGPMSASLSAFFYNKPSGTFAVWIPGSTVAAVNAEFMTIFPNQDIPIPAGTIFTAKCK